MIRLHPKTLHLQDFFFFVAVFFFSQLIHNGTLEPVSCFDFWIAEQALLSACVNWGSPPEACDNLILRPDAMAVPTASPATCAARRRSIV